MSAKINKWVVYEFREGRYVIVGKPQPTRKAAKKLRDKMNQSGRYGKKSLGVGRIG